MASDWTTVRVSRDLYERMQEAAQAERRSMTAWLAGAVEHHLAESGDAESAQEMADALAAALAPDALAVAVKPLVKRLRKQDKVLKKQAKALKRLKRLAKKIREDYEDYEDYD